MFFTWKFSTSRHAMVVETPLHIGLEPEGRRTIPIVGDRIPMVQVTQDFQGVCLSLRLIEIGTTITRHVREALKVQLADIERSDFEIEYERSVDRWNDRFETPKAAHRHALVRCRVA